MKTMIDHITNSLKKNIKEDKKRISNIQFIINRCKELVEAMEAGKDYTDEFDNIKSLIKTYDGSDYK